MESLNVSKKRILVVDDEQPIRTLIERAVKAAGLDCLTAGDGLEALEILKNEPVDIVITDVVMPHMTGIELTNKIRENFNADVIVMTGFVNDYRFEYVVAEGASDFVQKPTSLQEMVIRIKRVIQERENAAERNRMEQELQERSRRLKKRSRRHDQRSLPGYRNPGPLHIRAPEARFRTILPHRQGDSSSTRTA